VSDKDNLDLNFYVDVVNDECSSLLFPTRTGVTMLSRTLESLMIENNLQEIDLLKIDIEGAELLALKGAFKIISQYHSKYTEM
jgi:FkbM family methyltransferase